MARERYLLHGDEETINKPGAEVKPTTPKSKWDNFWFYHKWHVLIAVIAVFIAAILTHDSLSVVHPDYQIGIITERGYSDTATTALEKEFEKYGTDLNHDGKVVVQVNSYTIAVNGNAADPNVQMASVTKFTADLSDGASIIFLTDDASFKNQQQMQKMFAYTDGTNPPENATDYDRMRVSLKDCKKLQVLSSTAGIEGNDMLKNLSMSIRVIKGSAIEGKSDKQEYYQVSKKLFDQLIQK